MDWPKEHFRMLEDITATSREQHLIGGGKERRLETGNEKGSRVQPCSRHVEELQGHR
jgi:hypothetical protein